MTGEALAQQPQWSPSRIPDNSNVRPLNQSALNQAQLDQSRTPGNQSAFLAGAPSTSIEPHSAANSQSSAPNGEPLGSGVVLRWKTVAPTAASSEALAQASRLRQQATQEFADSAHSQPDFQAVNSVAKPATTNPLRSQVMQAAYQQGEPMAQNPFGANVAPPALPQGGSALPSLPTQPGTRPDAPSPLTPPQFEPSPFNSQSDALPLPGIDPLDNPELPPPPSASGDGRSANPNSILEDQSPSNPFPPRREDASPADRSGEPELVPAPRGTDDDLQDDNETDGGPELKRRQENTTSGYCDEMRARIHANPITAVSLDVSPKFGAGSRAKLDPEQRRLDFAAAAPVREWTDYRGYVVATGRMIDLRDGRVVIDVGGRDQTFPLRDLSDVDTTYVGEAWNIPERCGTGYDPFDGRDNVPSTVQWAASGLCHKPLYFEQVQLERYGHEIGPVLQPILGTAHFFGNIPLLPYKMGIHPPFECQYPLGYYRPGNCAPYMLQPIPWSLRGAAAQAAAVTGAAALIP